MPEKDKEYDRMTKKASPPSPKLKNSILAFLFGGTICTLGELFGFIYSEIGIDEKTTAMLIPVTLIVIAAALTGIGVFDKIAKHAGAGTLVPITGFANAVVSSGLEYTTDGKIYGTGAKMFTAHPSRCGCRRYHRRNALQNHDQHYQLHSGDG